jgi:peptidoglycan-N-acetylglucosamine deacetylase
MYANGAILRFFARAALCASVVAGGALLVDSTRSPSIATSAGRDHPYFSPQISDKHLNDARRSQGSDSSNKELVFNASDETELGLGRAYKNGLVMSGATPHRIILFTFDDGPDRRTTPLLLDRLDAVGVKAVFFLVASRIIGSNPLERQQENIAREIVRRGHIVGSHTYEHLQLPLLDNEKALYQVTETEKVFRKVFGNRPWLIRPPGGAHSPRIDEMLWNRGYTTMLWNLGAGDFQVSTAEQVFKTWRRVFERREVENRERGGIIMLHDTYPWSVDAFQLIFSDLMDRNCQLLSRGEELFDIVDDPSFFFQARSNELSGTVSPPAAPDRNILSGRQVHLRRETAERCRLNTFQ